MKTKEHTPTRFRAWITKYALTKGIIEAHVEDCFDIAQIWSITSDLAAAASTATIGIAPRLPPSSALARCAKVDIMRVILRKKVEQHPYVRKKLLETGDRLLVENSWRDSFWGWGPNQDGLNMLGKLWMEIRTELRTAEVSHGR